MVGDEQKKEAGQERSASLILSIKRWATMLLESSLYNGQVPVQLFQDIDDYQFRHSAGTSITVIRVEGIIISRRIRC